MNPIPIENQIKGWLMVAAVIVLTLFAAWPAHAEIYGLEPEFKNCCTLQMHDTLLQGGPRFAHASVADVSLVWPLVLLGLVFLFISGIALAAYYWPDGNDLGPDYRSREFEEAEENRHADEARRHWDQWK